MVVPVGNDVPLLRYSFGENTFQYDNSMELRLDGKISGVQRYTFADCSDDPLSGHWAHGTLDPDKVLDLVQRVKSAISGIAEDPSVKDLDSRVHHRVYLEAEGAKLSYVDVAPSLDVQRIAGELHRLFCSLPWPESVNDPEEGMDWDKFFDYGLPEATHAYHMEDH